MHVIIMHDSGKREREGQKYTYTDKEKILIGFSF